MKATIIFILACASLWMFACSTGCTYGYLADPIEPVILDTIEIPEQAELVDSCVLDDFQGHVFREVYAQAVDTMQNRVAIVVGDAHVLWIDNYEIQEYYVDIIADLVALYIPYTSFKIIDETTIDNGVMDIHFALFFVDPSGNWNRLVPNIYIEWGVAVDSFGYIPEWVMPEVVRFDGENVRIWVRESNANSIYLDTLANDNDFMVVNLLKMLPSWKILGMNGSNIDSTQGDNILRNGVAFDCKCCAIVRWKGLPPIDSALQVQLDYQQITVQL